MVEYEAILTADWHLSHTVPRARAEKNWYEVMERRFAELRFLQDGGQGGSFFPVPILIAGDLFDRWNPPLELVNFVLRKLPSNVHAIPGNHDLPHHNYEEMHRSGYGTLVEAGKIIPLDSWDSSKQLTTTRVHAFPFSFPVQSLLTPHDLVLEVAVIHDMIWTKKTSFKDAPAYKRLASYARKLRGYDVAVFGDNHKPFTARLESTLVFNCGSLFRRSVDQISHRPSVGLLYRDGTVERHYLDSSQDEFRSEEELRGLQPLPMGDMSRFLEEAQNVREAVYDFRERMHNVLQHDEIARVVKKITLQALEE